MAGWYEIDPWEFVADITGHATMQMAKKYAGQRRRARLVVERLDAATAARDDSESV